MKHTKKLLLILCLLTSHSAHADWSDLVKWASWAREKGILTPIGILPSPCTDKRTINGEEYVICPGVNFEGKNLASANLQGANLTRAHLTGANLRNANLTGANLEGAILKGAVLTKINLTGAKLNGANLENAVLDNADLSKADLSNAILTKANLEGVQLNNAILTNANLSGAKLNKADLANAVLRGANLSQADITNANFQAADLTECTIYDITQFAGAHGDVYRGTTFVDIQNVMRPISSPEKKPIYRYGGIRKPFSLREEEPSEIEFEYERPEPVSPPTPRASAPEAASQQLPLMQPAVASQSGQFVPASQTQSQLTAPAAVPTAGQVPAAALPGAHPNQSMIPMMQPVPTRPLTPSPEQSPTMLQKQIVSAIQGSRPASPDTPPTEIQKAAEIASPKPTEQTPPTTPPSEELGKEEATAQPKSVPTSVIKAEVSKKAAATIEQPKPLENTLIKRYLTKVDLLFTPDVKLNNHYVHEINALGEMVQHYPPLLRIHAKYVARPAEEFYKYLPKAEAGLQHKKYVENKLTELLEDLFKKIRTTLWKQEEIKDWVKGIIAQAFDKKESVREFHGFNRATGEMENMKDITITYTRKDKNSLINAIKQSFTTQLKKTVRPLMNAQTPIAQLYAYFDEINNQLNALTFRETAIGPMANLHNSLSAAVYKDRKLKPEFEQFKTTIDALLAQMSKKIILPNAEDMDSRYEKIEEVRKAFRIIRETMNREYEKRGKP